MKKPAFAFDFGWSVVQHNFIDSVDQSGFERL